MNDSTKTISEEKITRKPGLASQNGYHNFDAYYITALLFRYKYFILGFVTLSVVVSAILAFSMPNWYSATLNAVPPQNSSSLMEGAMGAINNTLKNFGLTKLGGSGSEGYSYMVILTSRTVKDSIIKKYELAKEYDLLDARKEEIRDAFDENLDITSETEGNYTITVWDKNPAKAAAIANDYVGIANTLSQKLYHSEASANREYLENKLAGTEDALRVVSDSLQKYSSRNMLFQPEAQATAISQSLAEMKAQLSMQEIALETTRRRFGDNDPYTTTQKGMVNDLRQKIQDAESKPGFGGNFALKNATQVGIEYMRLYTEYETFTKVKAFLLPLLEEARMNEFRSTKNLYVVDPAQAPEKKSRPKRSVIIAGAGLGSFVAAVLFIIAFNSYRNFKERYSQIISNNQLKDQ